MRTRLTFRAATLLVLAAWLAAAGCGVATRGELTAAECQDKARSDEDHDGLRNCDDPDCWVYDFCAAHTNAPLDERDAGTSARDDAGTMPMDSDGSVMTPIGSDAGGMVEPGSDAAVDPCALALCNADEICTAGGQCISGLLGDYDLRVSSAAVATANAASNCYDYSCTGTVSVPFLCKCQPDSFLTVFVNGVEVGHSTQVDDELNPTWPNSEPTIRVHIESAMDEIEFAVSDYDGTFTYDRNNPSTFIFSCLPELAGLAAGTLQCTAPYASVQASPPPPELKYRVTANVKRVPVQ